MVGETALDPQGSASAKELEGLSPLARMEAHGAAAERARIRLLALGWARQIEEDAIDSTAAPRAEVLRDFAALLKERER